MMDHEKNEVSLHEARTFLFVKGQKKWVSCREIAAATGTAERTVQNHVKRLVNLGIFDFAEVFPSHRFRFSDKANRRNLAYLQRLEFACEVFELV
jgi:hypothetical protein